MTRRSLFGRLVGAVVARKVAAVAVPVEPAVPAHWIAEFGYWCSRGMIQTAPLPEFDSDGRLWVPEGLSTFDERFRPGRLTKISETLNLRPLPRFTATPIPVERIPIPIRFRGGA